MKFDILLSGKTIEYELQYKKVKNINLRVRADGSVWVSANSRVSRAIIENFLRKKSDFIFTALGKYAQMENSQPPKLQYVSGEIVKFLGRDTELELLYGKRGDATIVSDILYLPVVSNATYEQRRAAYEKWCRNRCESLVMHICRAEYARFEKYVPTFPQIKIRSMKSRWGSCQPSKGILTFNTHLTSVPLECIEYVVVHEFTHFLHPNHSKNFYTALGQFMPGYKLRKKMLTAFLVE